MIPTVSRLQIQDYSIVKIAQLATYAIYEDINNIVVKASVSIKSLRYGNGRHEYFYMDLHDESGDITAVAYTGNEQCSNQLYIIQENKTYLFGNIALQKSNKCYTSIPNNNEIVLNNKSFVTLCGNAPKMEWPLTPLNEVNYTDVTKLFNIVGLCKRVSAPKLLNGELTRQVVLVDDAANQVTLNVWKQETSLFENLDLKFHPVIFAKDVRVFSCGSIMCLSTSNYLKLLHPDDPKAARIRKAILDNQWRNSAEIPSELPIQPHLPDWYPYCTPSNCAKTIRTNYVTIAEIDSATNDNCINAILIATVTIKSIKYPRDPGRRIFNMELQDHTGEITAIACNDSFSRCLNFIELNRTYVFSSFYVALSMQNTSIPHRKGLFLDCTSEIKLCGIAPKVLWPLSPLTVHRGPNETKYCHVFGRYTGTHEGSLISLVDYLGRELFLKLTRSQMALFYWHITMKDLIPTHTLDLATCPVLFAKDATMSDRIFKGHPILTNGCYLELLDSDDPRACLVTEALDTVMCDDSDSTAGVDHHRRRRHRRHRHHHESRKRRHQRRDKSDRHKRRYRRKY